MCRWFAYISPAEPCLLSDVLLTPANAITKQVSKHYLPGILPEGKEHDLWGTPDKLIKLRNHLLNYDGVGIAWYTDTASAYSRLQQGPRPALYKSPQPATNDFNLKVLCENVESKCLFAHVRASSSGTPSPQNSHPFHFGRHVFMHNGVVSHFSYIRRELTEMMGYAAYSCIQGGTDSEHAAGLYMTYLCGRNATVDTFQKSYTVEQMRVALQKTVTSIMELQSAMLGSKAVANTLNFCATDGERLVSCRFRNHATEDPSSLYWSDSAGRTLNRKYPGDPDELKPKPNPHQIFADDAQHGRHTIVASEPTTFDSREWTLIKRNCMLLVDESGARTEIPLMYEARLNFGS